MTDRLKAYREPNGEVRYWELPDFETKSFPTAILDVKEVDDAGSPAGIVQHIVAVIGNEDEGNDVIDPGAFLKTISDRGLRVKVLDQHGMDTTTRVVGKPIELREIARNELPDSILELAPDAQGGLLATTQYALKTTRGHDVFQLVAGGFLPEGSIGYDAVDSYYETKVDEAGVERQVRHLSEIRLWEYSNVIFGMNTATDVVGAKARKAQAQKQDDEPWLLLSLGDQWCIYVETDGGGLEPVADGCFKDQADAMLRVQELRAEREAEAEADEEGKAASGASGLPLADRGRAWDASAADKRVRSWADAADAPNGKYGRAFFYVDPDANDTFGGYKLGFADVIGGELTAIPRGIFAVAAVLQGSRGGVDIPDTDKAAIRRKVSAYYRRMRNEFDDEGIVPPWEKAGGSGGTDDAEPSEGAPGGQGENEAAPDDGGAEPPAQALTSDEDSLAYEARQVLREIAVMLLAED